MTIDRAAEEAAIAEAIAAGKRTVIPPVDPVERGIEVFRAEKSAAAGHSGGMRKTIVRAQKIKKAKNPERVAADDLELKPTDARAVKQANARTVAGRSSETKPGSVAPAAGSLDETGVSIKPGAGGSPAPKRSHKKKVDPLSAAARTCAKHGVIDCARCRNPLVGANFHYETIFATDQTEAIADLAYKIWQIGGCRHGHDTSDWLTAEWLLRREQT